MFNILLRTLSLFTSNCCTILSTDLDFSFLEMNPFTLVNGEPYPLDMRGELDDTAAFKNFKTYTFVILKNTQVRNFQLLHTFRVSYLYIVMLTGGAILSFRCLLEEY